MKPRTMLPLLVLLCLGISFSPGIAAPIGAQSTGTLSIDIYHTDDCLCIDMTILPVTGMTRMGNIFLSVETIYGTMASDGLYVENSGDDIAIYWSGFAWDYTYQSPAVKFALPRIYLPSDQTHIKASLSSFMTGELVEIDVQYLFEAPQNSTPEDQIAALIDYYDGNLGKTIEGVGKGNSAGNKARALGHMLASAQNMIEAGNYVLAAEQLNDVLKHADGQERPKDFVTGDGLTDFRTDLEDLIADLLG